MHVATCTPSLKDLHALAVSWRQRILCMSHSPSSHSPGWPWTSRAVTLGPRNKHTLSPHCDACRPFDDDSTVALWPGVFQVFPAKERPQCISPSILAVDAKPDPFTGVADVALLLLDMLLVLPCPHCQLFGSPIASH